MIAWNTLRTIFPLVKIIALNGNYGYRSGNNRGVNVAKGRWKKGAGSCKVFRYLTIKNTLK